MANKTTLAQLKLGFGMLYVVRLSDGRFVIVDGGVKCEAHKQVLLDYLEKKKVGTRPVIACWMFTHLDGDHVDNAFDILATHHESLEVQSFCLSIPSLEDFSFTEGESDDYHSYKEIAVRTQITRLEAFEAAKSYYPNAEIWTPHSGEHRRIADLDIHMLITAEERLPANVLSHNSRCLAFKFTFDSGHSCMITGDNDRSLRWKFIYEQYPAEILKSDVLQTMHHGLCGYLELHQAIDPAICFWPTSAARFLGYESDQNGTPSAMSKRMRSYPFNAWLLDDQIRTRTHYHGEQSVEIDMSDLSVTLMN